MRYRQNIQGPIGFCVHWKKNDALEDLHRKKRLEEFGVFQQRIVHYKIMTVVFDTYFSQY